MFTQNLFRLLLVAAVLIVAGVAVWNAVPRRPAYPSDPATISAHLRVILADTSSPEEVDRSVNRLFYTSHERVVEPTLFELAKLCSDGAEQEWIKHRQLRRTSEIPLAFRKQCQLWRVLTTHIRGGSTGLELQSMAKQLENGDTIWRMIRYLPDAPFDVDSVKMDLLHGLMDARLTQLRRARNGNSHNGQPAAPVAENAEIIRQAGRLLARIPPEEASHAYFFAIQFGDYVGVNFRPMDSKAPRYQGPNGLNHEFFSEFAQRAKAWWHDNQGRYSAQPRL